ncbi:MAG: DNA replication/repair protein RecF, partial [bacterium]
MLIKSLQVSQFRCWSYRQLQFDREITYLVGPNSSGKTTLLEAVNYLSTGRSFRTRRDGRLIKWGNSYYSIRGEFEEGPVRSIAVSYEDSPSRAFKQVKVDDELLSRLSGLQGLFPVVLFSPEQLNVLTGSPKNRRQFLNQLISQYSKEYLEKLKEYKGALHQRNSLLKKNSPDTTLLETYEKKMAQTAVYIYQQREKLLAELQDW